MGGHALKNVLISRIELAQYNKVKLDLIEKLGLILKLEFLIDVPNKTNFGDIDILYQNINEVNIKQILREIYNPIEIVSNGDVCSFSYQINDNGDIKYFQVDLIKCINFEMSKFYFSYGDLGGIIGRMTQYIGLKFGSLGLWICPNSQTINNFLHLEQNYKLKINLETILKNQLKDKSNYNMIINAQYSNIDLTSSPQIICEYLNLDWEEWENGFVSTEQIFKWIIKSKYFNLDQFRAMDYSYRQRAKKRPMFQDFLQYIFRDESEFTIENCNSKKYFNTNLQLESIEYFTKSKELENMIIQITYNLIRKYKFNGFKLIELGIIDKQIPICIKEFKKKLGFDNNTNNFDEFNNWLDLNDATTIDNTLRDFVNQYLKTNVFHT